LLELIVVLVVIGILAGLAVAGFRKMQAEANLETSAQRLLLDIRKAKVAANRSGIRHFVYFPGGGSKTWYIVNSTDAYALSPTTATGFDFTAFSHVSSDSLAVGVQFGTQGTATPSAVAALGATGTVPASGFGTVATTNVENCQDGQTYPLSPSIVPSGWASGTGGLIVACGGPTADLSLGVVYLTAKNTSKAYAIGYNDADGNGIQVRLFRYDGSAWEEVQ
jgi:Tfp pilus assembly protein FimT